MALNQTHLGATIASLKPYHHYTRCPNMRTILKLHYTNIKLISKVNDELTVGMKSNCLPIKFTKVCLHAQHHQAHQTSARTRL